MSETRLGLQRVATHVMARARHRATGKFGLRATPGGFGTPAFGPDIEVLRVDGPLLVRETAGNATAIALDGATLAALADFATVDLKDPFDVGRDTPALGDVDAPITIDIDDTNVL